MACERWRELLSAQLDGEDDPAGRPALDAHLDGCAACREWLDAAATVNRVTRTGAPATAPDLSAAILAAAGPVPPRRRRRPPVGALFALLAAVGAVQLVLGLSQIGGGPGEHVHAGTGAAPGHLWHESAAWNVAVGAGYLFLGLRGTRPSGPVPMLTAFVGMLVVLSVGDVSAGRVDATRLVAHGFVLLGYLLVLVLARASRTPDGPTGDARGRGWRLPPGRAAAGDDPPPVRALRLLPGGAVTASVSARADARVDAAA